MSRYQLHTLSDRPRPTAGALLRGLLFLFLLAMALAVVALMPASAQQPGDSVRSAAGSVTQESDTVKVMEIPGLVVHTSAPRTAASAAAFDARTLMLQAASTSADILRVVPGLAVAQHGGGGKADQYLIRGFDADHGTDLALFVEGIPVNMVSHAHGQGYADLGHVIPETVQSVEVRKGPYFAEYGNLSTAGTTEIRLRERFDRSFVQAETGSFDSRRLLAVWSPELEGSRGFVAIAGSATDGPFLDPQGFRRLNATGRWAIDVGESSELTFFGSGYDARWSASGQIPLRAVRDGRIDRFGAVDPSEGGDTRRIDASVRYQWALGGTAVLAQAWASRYELDLWSNFTFNLSDPDDGDGIVQRDRRTLGGGRVRLARSNRFGVFTAGLDLRIDDAAVLLGAQRDRVDGAVTVDSKLQERDIGFWIQQEVELTSWARLVAGLRHDRFAWRVQDRIGGGPAGSEERHITLPKASLTLTPFRSGATRLFLNYGRGFHGNDARAVVSDPSGTALAAAHGWEVGALQRLGSEVQVSAAWWMLDLEGELVWVGDEGVTELSGPTRRHGPEVEVGWTPHPSIAFEAGMTHTTARFRDSDDVVARAPRWMLRGAIGVRELSGWSGTLKGRSVRDIPLEESGVHRGRDVGIVDLVVGRSLPGGLELRLQVENLLDATVNEAQTWFASRLPGEAVGGVEDNHFTPGAPRALRIGLRWAR